MKKYIAYLLIPVACLTGTGCSNDDETEAFTVIKSEVIFRATPSTGYIVVSNSGDFTAESSAAWCTTECRNDSVIINASINKNLEGRTAVITITSAKGGVQKVPVTQYGAYFRVDNNNVLYATDEEVTLSYTVESAFNYQVTPSAQWISYTFTDKGINFILAPNTTGQPRRAYATIYCEEMDKQYKVELRQYDIDDFIGQWTATYLNRRGETVGQPINITRNGNQVSLTGLYEGVTINANTDGQTFSIPTHQDLGTHALNGASYRFYLFGMNEDKTIYSSENEDKILNYTCTPDWNEEEAFVCRFEGDSTFTDGKIMKGIAFTAYTLSGEKKGTVEQFYDLNLKR